VSESFNYVDERRKVIGITLLVFIFSATFRGYLLSNLTKQWKRFCVALHFLFFSGLISMAILLDVLTDHYFG